MDTISLIRLILGIAFICIGLFMFVFEVYGVFRLRYILDRMHLAGAGDTMGLFCTIIGAVIINGINLVSAKLILVLIFFWFASPVSSHLISRMVVGTDDDLDKHVKTCSEEESKKLVEGK